MSLSANIRKLKICYPIMASLLLGAALLSSPLNAAVKGGSIPHKISVGSKVDTAVLSSASAFGIGDISMQFVLATGIHKNLSLLLLHEVKGQQPVQDAIALYGMKKVQNTVVQAIRTAKSEHAAEWNEMLAGIYRKHFSDTELQSIMAEREASPYFGNLIEKQSLIAEEAKIGGKDIFNIAEADVLKRVSMDLPL